MDFIFTMDWIGFNKVQNPPQMNSQFHSQTVYDKITAVNNQLLRLLQIPCDYFALMTAHGQNRRQPHKVLMAGI